MFYKKLLKNLDIVLLWILLFYQFDDFVAIFNSSKNFSIFDSVFNIWFVILILLIYRLVRGENLINIILDELEIKFKKF